jgi:hypothetical protein
LRHETRKTTKKRTSRKSKKTETQIVENDNKSETELEKKLVEMKNAGVDLKTL